MNTTVDKYRNAALLILGNGLESSSGTTPEFMNFCKAFRKFLDAGAKSEGLELVKFSRGHFYASAYLQSKNGKFVHVFTSDVRDFGGSEAANICYRRASSSEDCHGERNNHSSFSDKNLFSKIAKLIAE